VLFSSSFISLFKIAGIINFFKVSSQVLKNSKWVIGKGSNIDSQYQTFPSSSVSLIIIGFKFSISQKETLNELIIGIFKTIISTFIIFIFYIKLLDKYQNTFSQNFHLSSNHLLVFQFINEIIFSFTLNIILVSSSLYVHISKNITSINSSKKVVSILFIPYLYIFKFSL
jgi:vacuolar-type H+-ATPase subunit F/Vma7